MGTPDDLIAGQPSDAVTGLFLYIQVERPPWSHPMETPYLDTSPLEPPPTEPHMEPLS